MNQLTIFFFIFFCSSCCAQSLSGTWKGSSEHSIWILNPVSTTMEIEVMNDSIITGVIHNNYTKGRYDHTKIDGIINWKDSIVNIDEVKEISHNVNTKVFETCLGKMKLKLTKKENAYHLDGKWKDKSRELFHCPTLEISFEKQIMPVVLLQPGSIVRLTDVQKVIELASDEIDSIKFALYDNAEIDDDTASVYFNDSLIMQKQRLSEKPVTFYLSFDKTRQLQKIRLFADNLGSIPPNTALLVITTRKNRYDITLSSDYLKNGSVEFFLKE